MKDPIPKFNGKVNTFAVFLLWFIDYALCDVKGVDGLHALDNVITCKKKFLEGASHLSSG